MNAQHRKAPDTTVSGAFPLATASPTGTEATPRPLHDTAPETIPALVAVAPLGKDRTAPHEVSEAWDPALPLPPSDTELGAYLRGPLRWVVLVQALAFVPILYSLTRFASTHAALWFFFAWVSLQVASMLIGVVTSARTRQVTARSHARTLADFAAAHPEGANLSVDIFLPTCGEPIEVLRNTYRHVTQTVQWGTVKVYVLDDAGRDEVHAAATEHGFTYISRPNKGEFKKAGNMLYAFHRTQGDLILVLDADFVPRHDIFEHLVPYFTDPEVGIVQSPQYFDTKKSMNWLERTAGATQETFYRWVQPSRDTISAAICVGTSAMYRREALAAAGGFAQIEHSEDVHTGVSLGKKGYRVRYVPALVTKGLCPAEVKGFLSQQYRWATGSLSLLTSKSFHTDPEFPLRRRLPYFSGFLYYINSALATFVSALPGGIMFWFFPDLIVPRNYLPFLGGLFVWFFLLPLVCHGRWRLEVLRVQALYSYAYLIACFDKVKGHTDAWVATGDAKAKNPTAVRAMRATRVGVTFSLLFTTSGLIHATFAVGLAQVWPAYLFVSLLIFVLGPLLWLPHVMTWRQAAAHLGRTVLARTASARKVSRYARDATDA
jgi:cellulose synthase (UDP-forming)